MGLLLMSVTPQQAEMGPLTLYNIREYVSHYSVCWGSLTVMCPFADLIDSDVVDELTLPYTSEQLRLCQCPVTQY